MSRLVCSEGGKILKNGMVVVEMMSWVVSNDNIFFFLSVGDIREVSDHEVWWFGG